VIAPALSAAFVAALEDVLAVYARPVDPRFPLVCFDEGGKELVAQITPPLPAQPGQPAREDHAYLRHGAANMFLAGAPYEGWRQIQVTERRTAVDFAHAVRALVDRQFPDAERIVLVTDNLNTHTPAAFYQAFPAPEARRILERLEWHDTPKHGSWLNMAELELSALARQCLARRIPDRPTLARAVAAWATDRNQQRVRIAWRFGIDDARVKLAHCYPVPEPDNPAVLEYSVVRPP
jgi:hypothetical protein